MRRTNNQDSHSLLLADTQELWDTRGHFFMVADGMGAHAAGEFASKLAAEGTPHLYHKYTDVSPLEALERAIRESNTEIHRRGTASAEFHGMGTTATSLVLLPQGAIIGHVGDSRCYRVRRGAVDGLGHGGRSVHQAAAPRSPMPSPSPLPCRCRCRRRRRRRRRGMARPLRTRVEPAPERRCTISRSRTTVLETGHGTHRRGREERSGQVSHLR